jgi:hypothetical protein
VTAPTTPTAWDPTPGRPAMRKDEAYWARVRRIVDSAPPLSDEQRAELRAIFHQPRTTRTEAA